MLPYNNKDITSIFNYSKQLVNRCLRDFVPDADEHKGKGGLGQLVEELFFKYDINSRQEADFAFVNAELKCTPLKKSAKNEDLLIKERLACSMINYTEDWNKSFEQSHFYRKCLIMLIMFYLHQSNVSKLDLHFLFAVLWKIPEKDLLIIRKDYETIISKIRNGKAETLSEGDTMYLGACRKGQKGDSLMVQHGSDIGAPRRAWSLKTTYMRIVLDEVKKNNVDGAYCNYDIKPTELEELISVDELKSHSVDDVLKGRFAPYVGLGYSEICKKLDINPITAKSKYFVIANAIASNKKIGNVNLSEELVKSGLTMKTIRINKNGKIKESMSFENIDYQEVYDCDEWTDSRLYELFTSRFMFVIFKETDNLLSLPNGKTESEYKLDKVAFWTMPQADLNVAMQYWENIRQCVKDDHISPEYFWGIKDNRDFHVRPKATLAKDMVDTPNGTKAKKYCYWFNAKYVKNIIDNEI
ncbi:Sau3AI family type II restriction endonuclease [Prevotella pectinovora]|uniref:Sau3AI family type II restriction endonuclease n=2 Tax=Prevotella pectinovora TaxID=1602169 RepID=UPI0030791F84